MAVSASDLAAGSDIAPIGLWGARPLWWLRTAWHRTSWRQLALACVLYMVVAVIGPNGGILLYPGRVTDNLIVAFLSGSCLTTAMPLIFGAMVADAAIEDGARPWLAYGIAWLVGSIGAPFLEGFVGRFTGHFSTTSFWILALLLQGGLGMGVYGYWRTTDRARRVVRQAEARRIQDRKRIHATRLMALQARVDPDLLFDTLTRVGAMHVEDASAADVVLDELIVLLRAMLPGRSLAASTVAREARLVEAWIRVVSRGRPPSPKVEQTVPPDLSTEPIAPMVVAPLILAALDAIPHATRPWSLRYAIAGSRLQVALSPELGAVAVGMTDAMFAPLRRRLDEIYGESALLTVDPSPPKWVLDVPRMPAEVLA